MATPAPDRARLIASIQQRLDEAQRRIDDDTDVEKGLAHGLVSRDEVRFALGLDNAPDTHTLFPSQRGPYAQLAQTTRYRLDLDAVRRAGGDTANDIEIMDESARRGVATFLPNLLELSTDMARRFGVPFRRAVGAITGNMPDEQGDIERNRAFFDTMREQAGTAAGAGQIRDDQDLREFSKMIVARAHGRGLIGSMAESGAMSRMVGQELIPLVALQSLGTRLFGAADEAAQLGVGGMGRFSALTHAMAPLFETQAATEGTGVLSRVLPATSKGVLAQAAGAAAGATLMVASAPENTTGEEMALRAMTGVGLGVLGVTAALGRPYGVEARTLVPLIDGSLAAVSPNAAKALLTDPTVTNLSRFTLAAWRARLGQGFTAALTHSPRTTVGQLLGAGALGASWTTARAIEEGADVPTAIGKGVMEGGMWMGTDIAFARLGGVARLAGWQTMWTDQAGAWMTALGLPRLQPAVSSLAPVARMAGGAALGGAAGAVAGGGLGDALGIESSAPAIAGGLIGAAVLSRMHARLGTFLPRDLLRRVVQGEWGALSSQEASQVAEAVFAGATRDTVLASRDPLWHELLSHITGPASVPRAPASYHSARFAFDSMAQAARDARGGELPSQALVRTGRSVFYGEPGGIVGTDAGEVAATGAHREFMATTRGLPAPSGQPLDPTIVREDARYLFDRINVLRIAARERTASLTSNLRSADKKVGKVELKAALAADPYLAQLRQEGADAVARLKGALDRGPGELHALPPLTATGVEREVGRIKSRQVELLNELRALESGPQLHPDVLSRSLEYAQLRDQYATILQSGGIESAAAEQAAREAFNLPAPPVTETVRAATTSHLTPDRVRAFLGTLHAGRTEQFPLARRTLGKGSNATAIPDTIVPGAVSSVVTHPADVRSFLADHGLTLAESLDPATGRTLFNVASGAGRALTTPREGLRQVLDDLGAAAARQQRERGASDILPQLGAVVVGGTFGAWLVPTLNRVFTDEEGTPGQALTGGIIGGIAAALLMARRTGHTLTADAARFLKFVVPRVESPIAREVALPKLGRGSDVVPRHDFARFDIPTQNDHVIARVGKIAARVTKTATDRATQLDKFLVRYAPFAIPPDKYADLERAVVGALKATGSSDGESFMRFRGFVRRAEQTLADRTFGAHAPTLDDLTRDPTSIVTTARGFDELRNIVNAAKVVGGDDLPLWRKLRNRNRGYQDLHSKSESGRTIREFVELQQTEAYAAGGPPVGTLHRFLGGFRSLESLITDADALQAQGNPVGQAIRNVASILRNTYHEADSDIQVYRARKNAIFNNMPLEQREAVTRVMQGSRGFGNNPDWTARDWRTFYTGRNDRIITAADQMKALKDEIATKNGLPPEAWEVDHAPWYYSPRSIRELIATGGPRANEPFLESTGLGMPRYKVWRSMFERTSDRPLAPILMDPLEWGDLYLYGGIRKYHIDRLLNAVPPSELRRIAQAGQPYVAADISKSILDFHGVPTSAYLRADTMLRGLGASLHNVAFDRTEFTRALSGWMADNVDPRRVAAAVRSLEVAGKLWWNLSSSMVNLTQLGVNGGADLPLSVLMESTYRLGTEQARRSTFFGSWIKPNATSAEMYDAVVKTGVASTRMLENIQLHGALHFGFLKAKAGAIGGLAGLAIPNEDIPGGAKTTFAAGVLAGIGGAHAAPMFIAKSLRNLRTSGMAIFETVEVLNRTIVAGAAHSEAKRAATGVKDVARTVLEHGALGGAVGLASAAPGYARGELDAGDVAARGAIGTAIGLGVGRLAEPFSTRAARDLSRIKPITPGDAHTWYLRQMTAQTQFAQTRAMRGHYLQTPLGDALSSLQSYTIGQMEFTGARFTSFARSLGYGAAAGANRPIGELVGQVDTRFLRHLALLYGTASMMSAVSVGTEDETDTDYWLERLGLGFAPFLDLNRATGEWKVLDIGQAFAGPVPRDLARIANTYLELMRTAWDPEARANWDMAVDDLANGLWVFSNRVQRTDAAADTAARLGAEGIADLLRETELRDAMERVGRPVGTLTHDAPTPRRELRN